MSSTRHGFTQGIVFGFIVSVSFITILNHLSSVWRTSQSDENYSLSLLNQQLNISENVSQQRHLLLPNIRAPVPRFTNEAIHPLFNSENVVEKLNSMKASISINNDSYKPTKLSESHNHNKINPTSFNFRNDLNSVELTREKCENKRKFFDLDEKRLPPMFYTFPGSGNTWGRLLIEHATGIYTGSVYNDKSLLSALPGEFTCDWRVSAVKVHPHTHRFADLYDGTFHSDENKCRRGNVKRFQRAILLIRDPYDSIWSEYQRRFTQSHVEGILKDGFDWRRWQANAAALSHAYFTMWDQHYKNIERSYKSNDILYIRYEDLKNKTTRIAELRKVTRFLNFHVSDEKLQCAFFLAENKKAHRSIDTDLEMTKDLAYTPELVCRMWTLFGNFSLEHSYHPFNSIDCSSGSFPAIPKVNVGPRGEYDNKWVKPGEKMIDLVGYESKGNSKLSAVALSRKDVLRIQSHVVNGFSKLVTGLTMEDAMLVSGIAKLGEEGPIWN